MFHIVLSVTMCSVSTADSAELDEISLPRPTVEHGRHWYASDKRFCVTAFFLHPGMKLPGSDLCVCEDPVHFFVGQFLDICPCLLQTKHFVPLPLSGQYRPWCPDSPQLNYFAGL